MPDFPRAAVAARPDAPDAAANAGAPATFVAFVAITRPLNCLLAATGAGIGAAWAAQWADVALAQGVLATAAVACVTAFGNVLNDLGDVAVDRVAHPKRPLVSGALGSSAVRWFAGGLLAAGLGCAAALGWTSTVAALAVILLLLGYEAWWKAKPLAGNTIVALLTACVFPFGALAGGLGALQWRVAHTPSGPNPVWILTAMAALASLAREVAKDVEDREADKGYRRTIALWRPQAIRPWVVVPSSVAAALGMALLPALLDMAGQGGALATPRGGIIWLRTGLWGLVSGVLLLAGVAAIVAGALTRLAQAGRLQRLLKTGMACALAACALAGAIALPR